MATILPEKLLNSYRQQLNYLGRNPNELNITIGQSLIIFFVAYFFYYFSKNTIWLGAAFFLPLASFLEIPMAVSKHKKSIEESVTHVVSCLKVLVVSTETPLNTALDNINQGLPQYMSPMKKELVRLLEKAEKSSMQETLMEWQTDSNAFKDFLALLISIHGGASKAAVKNVIDNFLEKAHEEMQETIKNKAENLQMVLMGPVIIMFLIIMMPMMEAINYTMNKGMQF